MKFADVKIGDRFTSNGKTWRRTEQAVDNGTPYNAVTLETEGRGVFGWFGDGVEVEAVSVTPEPVIEEPQP